MLRLREVKAVAQGRTSKWWQQLEKKKALPVHPGMIDNSLLVLLKLICLRITKGWGHGMRSCQNADSDSGDLGYWSETLQFSHTPSDGDSACPQTTI